MVGTRRKRSKTKRGKLYTETVLRNIRRWVKEGIPRDEIARRIGTTPGSLTSSCSYYGIRLSNNANRNVSVKIRVKAHVAQGIREKAGEHGRTQQQFMSRLLEIIHNDNLYDAVLDQRE